MPRRFPGIDHLLRDFSLIPGEKKGKKTSFACEGDRSMYGSSHPVTPACQLNFSSSLPTHFSAYALVEISIHACPLRWGRMEGEEGEEE